MRKAVQEVSQYGSADSNRLKLTIDDREQRYFREIFNLNVMKNEDGSEMSVKRINEQGLNQIFTMIGFEPNK